MMNGDNEPKHTSIMAKRVDGDPQKDVTVAKWVELTNALLTQNMFKNMNLKLCKEVTALAMRVAGEATQWGFVKLEQSIGGLKTKMNKMYGKLGAAK